MIKIKNIITGDIEVIAPSIFPDKTSQVWQLNEGLRNSTVKITWNWDGDEAELIHLNQLICLLYQMNTKITELYIPYLPYARQDKVIDNNTTFSKFVFLEMLFTDNINKITTLDVHSESYKVYSYKPFKYIMEAINQSKANVLVFPDKGAYNRYAQWFAKFNELSFIVLDKVRNQLTGKIEGLQINKDLTTFEDWGQDNVNMLIVDDLSDYGGTFKYAAKYLKGIYENINISLYVTHFLGHGEFSSYKEAGIDNVYTTNSLDTYRTRFNYKAEGLVVIKG